MSDTRAVIARAGDLFQAGKKQEAVALLAGLVGERPDDLEARSNLVMALSLAGRAGEARAHAEEGARRTPEVAESWSLLAQVAVHQDDKPAAETAARRAVELEPGNPDRVRGLAWILHRSDRYLEAAEWAERGLALVPADADLWLKRAVAIQCTGRVEEALEVYRRGSAACPHAAVLWEGYANCATYDARMEPREVLAVHKKFGAALEREAIGARPPAADRGAGVARPLRVGLLSADLREHSVATFARPLIEHHGACGVELFIYHYGQMEDGVTAELRAPVPAARWRHAVGAAAEEIAAAVRADGVDVLVELAGLTRGHHLRVMALRPAPMLATYMGYANTTGLRCIDLRVVDSHTDPAGSEGLAVERLVRIDPCFLCYTPPRDAPACGPGPRARGAAPAFGSFNVVTKVNGATLGLWKRVLEAGPGTRLVVKSRGIEHEAVRADVRARMRAAGIDVERVDLLGRVQERAGHLAAYARVDVALDPFPYHGTTTTCEALYMGVPVATLAGPTHASRVGVSLLTNAGLPELVARSEEEYVRLAAELMADGARLDRWRGALRGQLLASPLCDGPGLARRFFVAIGAAWAERFGRRGGGGGSGGGKGR